jgi:Zn-dependent peptidase ImmA (M78 family)
MPSRPEIERSATALLKEAGLEDQFPVPLEQIANFLGYKTSGFTPGTGDGETSRISGLINYDGREIYVNIAESLARQRFTLAHEIGHAYLHKKTEGAIVDFRAEIDNPSSEKEREANQFSAALLMPKEEFVRQWVKLKSDVDLLSKVFGVSKESIKFRIQNTVNAGM